MGELKALGASAEANKYLYDKPDPKLLERFPNPAPDNDLSVEISNPEFTSLCPMTGQPDFATIEITYSPDKWCVESKSLKMYFMGYRMHGDFHEACVKRIVDDLVALLDPKWMQCEGKFTPRGGIPFHPSIYYVRPSAREDPS